MDEKRKFHINQKQIRGKPQVSAFKGGAEERQRIQHSRGTSLHKLSSSSSSSSNKIVVVKIKKSFSSSPPPLPPAAAAAHNEEADMELNIWPTL